MILHFPAMGKNVLHFDEIYTLLIKNTLKIIINCHYNNKQNIQPISIIKKTIRINQTYNQQFHKMMEAKIILILILFVLQISTLTCLPGFALKGLDDCSNSYGPCATGNQDLLSIPLPIYATRCLTCFSDAILYQTSITASICIPKACTFFNNANGCSACQTGYSLSVNKSCILNFVDQTKITNNAVTINNTLPNPNIHTCNMITQSLIISAAAVICVILCFIFKLTYQFKQKKDLAPTPESKDQKMNNNVIDFESTLVFVGPRNQSEKN